VSGYPIQSKGLSAKGGRGIARLGKPKLIAVVLGAIRAAGWTVTLVSPPGAHPARSTMAKGPQQQAVRVYICYDFVRSHLRCFKRNGFSAFLFIE
jgi:hypothetical protein